mmetsp:Transcript_11857/g.31874  ORF Transcript_11857/g.31874 Transcript_11857/m.31874 type:complete len:386 (+) Transcript_11857:182-1339(+)
MASLSAQAEPVLASSQYVSIDELDSHASATSHAVDYVPAPGFTSHHRLQLFMVIAGMSVLELTCASALCSVHGECHVNHGWAVGHGAVSTGLSALYPILVFAGSGYAQSALEPVSMTLWWWSIAGVVTLTFAGPFQHIGNGFLSCWAILGASSYLLYNSSPAFRGIVHDANDNLPHGIYVKLIALASGVEAASAITSCATSACTSHGQGWAIFVGLASTAACAALFTLLGDDGTVLGEFNRIDTVSNFGLAMLTWWTIGVWSLTIAPGPFWEVGVGYLATWAALASSLAVVFYGAGRGGVLDRSGVAPVHRGGGAPGRAPASSQVQPPFPASLPSSALKSALPADIRAAAAGTEGNADVRTQAQALLQAESVADNDEDGDENRRL